MHKDLSGGRGVRLGPALVAAARRTTQDIAVDDCARIRTL